MDITLATKKYAAVSAAVLLAWYPGAARGQAGDSTGRQGRWYVGGGAAFHQYFTLNRPYSLRISPAYVSGGYGITPRLAVQAEVQHGQRIEESSHQGVVDGELFTFEYKEQTTSTALSVLARFGRSQPQRKLQFDWLLGVAVVHARLAETTTRRSATRSNSYVYPVMSSTERHLVWGGGLRYRLGPRLAAETEVLVSKNLGIPPFGYWGLIPGGGATVGVSYLFGPAKP